jgi:hypothetical protein
MSVIVEAYSFLTQDFPFEIYLLLKNLWIFFIHFRLISLEEEYNIINPSYLNIIPKLIHRTYGLQLK